MNEDCCPAKDASPRSSAVADDLTETKIGSRADFNIASAPGEPFISSKSTLKWSYASRISSCNCFDISAFSTSVLISLALSCRSFVLSGSILWRRSFIGCSNFACFRNEKNAVVVTTKACGTGNFALYISPRFAPFPPTRLKSSLDKLDNHAIDFSPILILVSYSI